MVLLELKQTLCGIKAYLCSVSVYGSMTWGGGDWLSVKRDHVFYYDTVATLITSGAKHLKHAVVEK